MELRCQFEFVDDIFSNHVFATSWVDNEFTNLACNSTLWVEQVMSLRVFINVAWSETNTPNDQAWSTVCDKILGFLNGLCDFLIINYLYIIASSIKEKTPAILFWTIGLMVTDLVASETTKWRWSRCWLVRKRHEGVSVCWGSKASVGFEFCCCWAGWVGREAYQEKLLVVCVSMVSACWWASDKVNGLNKLMVCWICWWRSTVNRATNCGSESWRLTRVRSKKRYVEYSATERGPWRILCKRWNLSWS